MLMPVKKSVRATLNYTVDNGRAPDYYFYEPDPGTELNPPGTDLHEAMGASEISTFLSGSPDRPAPMGTAGFPPPGRHVAILGDDGPLPPGQPGALAVRRDDPGLFLGYLDDPDATHACFRGDWFLTGDMAQADDVMAYIAGTFPQFLVHHPNSQLQNPYGARNECPHRQPERDTYP
mgnify:CR=1 FL=1